MCSRTGRRLAAIVGGDAPRVSAEDRARPAAKAFPARNGRQVKTDMLFRASWLANMQAFGNAAGLIGLKT